MKLNWLISLVLLQTLAACTYDNEEDLFGEMDCSTTPATFSAVIAPIIQVNCAVPGCHVANAQFPDFTDFKNIQDNAITIKSRVENGTMPPASSGKSLTLEQINAITCWVENGAKNN